MNRTSVIAEYAQSVVDKFNSGHAKEHAYRPALEKLMSSFEDVTAVNDPKRSEHGNPDMVFLKDSNKSIILGYAEAKDVDISLDKTEKTNQMHRYSGYDNLYLTNYLEFRFYLNGEKHSVIEIAKLKNGVIELLPQNYGMLADELDNFISAQPESIRSGKRLALIMGAKARRIRDRVNRKFNDEDIKSDELNKIYDVMRQLLVHDLTVEKFADMYAQTLVYGLFVARYGDQTKESFSREEARELVPASNPFLKDFFDHIAGSRFDKDLAQIVNELCEVFQASDVNTLVHKHLKLFELDDDSDKDPIIHFYEDFLKEYDSDERKRMGAYYTPVPVVRFIVRQVDKILKEEFGLVKGLADISKKPVTITNQGTKHKVELHRVQILDPAVGTATFLNETIKHIRKNFEGQEGRWESYVNDDLLPRLHGFELMMAPYTIAHLKLGMTLQETGVKDISKRIGVYLTNTLEEGAKLQNDLFASLGLAETISHEAQEAGKIKNERPVMVVIGNPPYSGVSSNETEYANELIKKYKVEPGGQQKLQEKKHWLNDDYVKFLAFAEELISKNRSGVVAMITNNGYLDNPTFRGMRWQLTKTFDKIYVLDLHGNSKKKEIAPDGTKDENVFDIMQGVGIILAVKNSKKQGKLADVFHAEIYGKRKVKFDKLSAGVKFSQISYDLKNVYFIPKDMTGQAEYDLGLPLNKLFMKNGKGVVTGRDKFTIDFNEDVLEKRVEEFSTLEIEEARTRYSLGKDSTTWKIEWAQADLRKNFSSDVIKEICYRPFDKRYVVYLKQSSGMIVRPSQSIMQQFDKKQNIGLMLCRQQKQEGFQHVFIHEGLAESCFVSNRTSEIGTTFPLYVYHNDGTKVANFSPSELSSFVRRLSSRPSPEEVLDYIYAVLHSPRYRETYKEFLKLDFPRVPIPANDAEFSCLADLGNRLRKLHLMESPTVDEFTTIYSESGDNLIEKIEYTSGNVYINNNQYFGNVPEIAWNFYVGGYQPAQKWLKDRKNRTLSNHDIEHYQKIIKILTETDRIMQEIDGMWSISSEDQ